MRVALAKLYQNTGRIADVGAVLEPALKGFTQPWNSPK